MKVEHLCIYVSFESDDFYIIDCIKNRGFVLQLPFFQNSYCVVEKKVSNLAIKYFCCSNTYYI